MARIRNIQNKIRQVEGFSVAFKHRHNDRDVMDNKEDVSLYRFSNAAPGNKRVTDWKETRFNKSYANFKVEVLDGGRKPVNGKTLLRNVRASY